MADNKVDWYKSLFTCDEAEKSKRFYTDLTDDDIAYLEAATRHDFDVTEGMLYKYFRLKMPNTNVLHKVWRRDRKSDIWVYDINRKVKSDVGWLGEGVYFYGNEDAAWEAYDYGPYVHGFFINAERPFQMDIDLHRAVTHKNEMEISRRMTDYVKTREFDSVVYYGDGREEWCVLKPNQLKRAEVTRDDQGRIIPISKRFDLSKKDCRY